MLINQPVSEITYADPWLWFLSASCGIFDACCPYLFGKFIFTTVILINNRSQWPILCWDCGLEFRREHVFLCCVFTVKDIGTKARTFKTETNTEKYKERIRK
jgi:hypothetical protein